MKLSGMMPSLMLSNPAAHLDNNSQFQSFLQSHTADAHNYPATHLAGTIRSIVTRAVAWMLKISLLEACLQGGSAAVSDYGSCT